MRIAVVGPGAVGGLVGALLTRAGHDVCFVARPATSAALADRGLTVHSEMFGNFTVPVRAADHLAGPADLCIVAVKAPDLPRVLRDVSTSALGEGVVLPLLNGWEHLGPLARRFGQHAVLGGAIRVEATRTGPTTVEHLSPFIRVTLGAMAPTRSLDAVRAALDGAGITTDVATDALATVWEKLVFLAPFALITARWQLGIGAARDRHRADLEALVAESTAVGATFGAGPDAAALLRFIDALPPAMTSSLRRDLEAGRPDELDAIAGGVVRAGHAAGVRVDAHERLIAEIRDGDGPPGQRILPVDPAGAAGSTKDLLELARKRFGRVPNALRVLATSPPAFAAWWEFDRALAAGSLPPAVQEQLAVLVASLNGCVYCASAHTAAARAAGVGDNDLLRAQHAAASDPQADAALAFALEAIATRGDVPDTAIGHAKAAGLTDAQLIEILAVVAINTFNNLYIRLAKPALDFPAVSLRPVLNP